MRTRDLKNGPASAADLPVAIPGARARRPGLKYWYGYITLIYAVWLTLIVALDLWRVTRDHWPMSVVMVLGSVVAGSTPMGGGTVAFPVLVLLFHQSPHLGRNFGLAIQAAGMTSAMVFILSRRTRIQARMLRWGIPGAALGLLLGTFVIAPILSGNDVKLLFSSLWMSFGLLTLLKNGEICAFSQVPVMDRARDAALAVTVGVIGGAVSSIIGVGIEMLAYTALVLRYRCDLKAAVPTAVCMGGVTSLMGIALHGVIGDIEPEVFYNWMAAVPIVILGAPVGAYLVSIIPRIHTLYFVSILCALQFLWTLQQVSPTLGEWIFLGTSLVGALAGFYALYRAGKRPNRESAARQEPRRRESPN